DAGIGVSGAFASDLTTQILLDSVLAVSGTLPQPSLTTSIALTSSLPVSLGTGAELSTQVVFDSQFSGTCMLGSQLATAIVLDTSIVASASVSAQLLLPVLFDAAISAAVETAADLETAINLVSALTATAMFMPAGLADEIILVLYLTATFSQTHAVTATF
ncbi:MAG: hypothetical protein Q9M19_04950, partial [Mariprofundaceae bacterium]|nr:hypothetical protein [Mariprofundaceae bacterium]